MLKLCRFIAGHPLSRGRATRNLARAAWFQLRSRVSAAPVLFDYVNGARLYAARGLQAVTGNLYVGLHEFEDMAFVGHALRPGDLFADVGANVGAYAILAASVGADVVAFEPVEATRRWLERNVAINHKEDRISIRNEAVGEEAGSVDFVTDLGASNRAVQPGERRAGVVTVPVTSLDLAFRDRAPTVMKVDVEGYETLVARGGERTLGSPDLKAIIMEFNGSGAPFGFDEAELLRSITARGFTTMTYRPFERAFAPPDPDAMKTSDNVLFVRDPAEMAARLASAPKLDVRGIDL